MLLTLQPSSIVEFTRIYLAVFYTCVAVFYTGKIVFTKHRCTNELVFSGKRYCQTWWNHITFRLFRVIIWLVCVYRWFIPSVDNVLGLFSGLATFGVILCGNILLTSGFLMTLLVHFSMGEKWRSGIDPHGPKHLITTGFYGYSRNPIFISIGVSQIGFFLALPSIFTLACLVIGLYTLYRQTLCEEHHLASRLPDEYRVYAANTRRWW